jgi:predicted phosphodiesterase
MKQSVSEDEFIQLWAECGSPTLMAERIGTSPRNVMARRADIETRRKIKLVTFNDQSARRASRDFKATIKRHEGRVDLEMQDGVVIVFSDAHYYPGFVSTAHRALLMLIQQLKPKAIICNGDAFDGATISKHARIGWDKKPTVEEELKVVDERLVEIEKAGGHGVEYVWCLGNHDARYETFLAAKAPQFEGVRGFTLKDHFPRWQPCWSTWINDEVVVKHRFRSGIHAPHNNTVNSGKTIVTGHLHQLKVQPFSDYNGRRYGVDSGTLADPYGSQFVDYTEANPVNWHSGFVILTFKNGKLLSPELVAKYDEGIVEFMGHLLDADTGAVM